MIEKFSECRTVLLSVAYVLAGPGLLPAWGVILISTALHWSGISYHSCNSSAPTSFQLSCCFLVVQVWDIPLQRKQQWSLLQSPLLEYLAIFDDSLAFCSSCDNLLMFLWYNKMSLSKYLNHVWLYGLGTGCSLFSSLIIIHLGKNWS